MTILNALGIYKIGPGTIIKVLVTLLLFGLSTNGLFDLWKLSPTLFMEGPGDIDWRNLALCLIPSIAFSAWIFVAYLIWRQHMGALQPVLVEAREVTPHKGVVLALSLPKQSSAEIIDKIGKAPAKDPSSLFSEWSIGQLFKALYHHRAQLRHVWPLATDSSKDHRQSIEAFLKKYIPKAAIVGDAAACLLKEADELRLIEEIKMKLAAVYAKENLSGLDIKSSDIVVDITGGTKPMSIGLIFGALDSSIDIQYVEQKRYDVIPLAITPEVVLDKVAEYLLGLYSKLQQMRKETAPCR